MEKLYNARTAAAYVREHQLNHLARKRKIWAMLALKLRWEGRSACVYAFNSTSSHPLKRANKSSSTHRLHVLRDTVALRPFLWGKCLPDATACYGRRRRTTSAFTCQVAAAAFPRAIACCYGGRITPRSHSIPEKKSLNDVLRQGLPTVCESPPPDSVHPHPRVAVVGVSTRVGGGGGYKPRESVRRITGDYMSVFLQS